MDSQNVVKRETKKKSVEQNSIKRTRKTTHKMSLGDYIRAHSPIKNGLRVDDEDMPLAKYNKIMSRIFIGNFEAAKDREFFKKHNIRAVLNCTKEIPNHFAHNRDIEYMRIPVDDSLKDKDYNLMFEFMPVIAAYIHKHAVIQGNNILIHCVAGRQRSCGSAAAFLICHHNMTPHEACQMIMQKRPEAFHFGKSLNFDQALNKYYKTLSKSKGK
jgi:protein-tyrosine phosphatase